MPEGFIPPHGGYANLLSYRKVEIVYDATVYFCPGNQRQDEHSLECLRCLDDAQVSCMASAIDCLGGTIACGQDIADAVA